MAKHPVKDIKPNPFRDLINHPLDPVKVDSLRASMKATGIWPGLVGRKLNGVIEGAFGHHRVEAASQEFGPDKLVEISIEDLSDDLMLQMMARENSEEWATQASRELEIVAATVLAYEAGRITLDKAKGGYHQFRYAHPSGRYCIGGGQVRPPDKAYTAQSIASKLGMLKPSGEVQHKVKMALRALDLIDQGILTQQTFVGLNTSQAEAVVTQANKAKKKLDNSADIMAQKVVQETEKMAAAKKKEDAAETKEERDAAAQEHDSAQKRKSDAEKTEQERRTKGKREAKIVGRGISEQLRGGDITTNQASAAAWNISEKESQKLPPPNIEKGIQTVATRVNHILAERSDVTAKKLEELVQHRDNLPDYERQDLVKTLESLRDRVSRYINLLGDNPVAAPQEVEPIEAKQIEVPAIMEGVVVGDE